MSWETLPTAHSPPMCPKAGYRYVYEWIESSQKNDWKADGYQWRQTGICKPKKDSVTTNRKAVPTELK